VTAPGAPSVPSAPGAPGAWPSTSDPLLPSTSDGLRPSTSDGPPPRTPFGEIPDEQLAVMLHRGDPELVRATAAAWGRVAVLLEDSAERIAADHRVLAPTWTGRIAERYAQTVAGTATAARRAARRAAAVRDVLHDAAEALERAQRAAGAPVPAPPRPPGLLEALAGDEVHAVPDLLAAAAARTDLWGPR
jgi:uncharacterized protein YukE